MDKDSPDSAPPASPTVATVQPRKRLSHRLLAGMGMLVLAGSVGVALFLASRPQPGPAAAEVSETALMRAGALNGAQAIAMARSMATAAFGAAEQSANPGADAARSTFTDAATLLVQDPDPAVRGAIEAAADPTQRTAGLNTLWRLAQDRGDAAPALVRASAALFTALGDGRADDALSLALTRNPEDADLWRLMAVTHLRLGERQQARGAGVLADALDAARRGDRLGAAALFRSALGIVQRAQALAFVHGRLGDYAAEASEFRSAAGHYRDALALHRQRGDLGAMAIEAHKLARTLVVLGEEAGACAVLREAAGSGAPIPASPSQEACAPLTSRPSVKP